MKVKEYFRQSPPLSSNINVRTQLLVCRATQELVEHMECSLAVGLVDYTGLHME